jgi:hypothetical protein
MLNISHQDQFSLRAFSSNLTIEHGISISYLPRFPSVSQIFDALRGGNVGQLDEWIVGSHYPDWADLIEGQETVDIAAIRSGSPEMLDYVLLYGGRNAYRKGPDNIPLPFHLAIELGRADLIDILIKHHVPVDEHDRHGITPLQKALRHRDFVAAESLYCAGAGINIQDVDGNTPLHIAVRNQDRFAVNWLLKRGALPNVQTANDRSTPLHYAVHSGNVNVAVDLMTYGAWHNLQNERRCSPRQLAFDYKHVWLLMVMDQNAAHARECLRKSIPIETSYEIRKKGAVASFAVEPEMMRLLNIGDEVIRTTRQGIVHIGNQMLHTEIYNGSNTERLLKMRQLRLSMPYQNPDPLWQSLATARLAVAMGVGNCRELASNVFFELLPKLGAHYTIELVAHDVYDHVFVIVRTDEHEVMVVDAWPTYPHATRPLDFHMLDHDVRKEIYGMEDQEGGSNLNNSRIVDILNAQMNSGPNVSRGSYKNIHSTHGFRVALSMPGMEGNESRITQVDCAKEDIDKWAEELCKEQEFVCIFQHEIASVTALGRQVLWPTCLGGPVRYYEVPEPGS